MTLRSLICSSFALALSVPPLPSATLSGSVLLRDSRVDAVKRLKDYSGVVVSVFLQEIIKLQKKMAVRKTFNFFIFLFGFNFNDFCFYSFVYVRGQCLTGTHSLTNWLQQFYTNSKKCHFP